MLSFILKGGLWSGYLDTDVARFESCLHTLFTFHTFLVYCNDFLAVLRIQLNDDQQTIVDFAAEGHNLLITGQAGVGKSEVVKRIIATINTRGRNVGIVCSSGIACQVYDRGLASTVHSFYRLMTADLPWRQLIDRSIGNSVVCDRVKAIDVIIWDEASMSSQRMFELVNFMHHELTDNPLNRTYPSASPLSTVYRGRPA